MSNNRLKKSSKPRPEFGEPRTHPRREDGTETRSKLVQAAGELFARDGFRAANLREICAKAGANLGAIRYYFGTKNALYRETLFGAYADVSNQSKLHPDNESGAGMNLEEWVQEFSKAMLHRRKEYPYLPAMISRELAHPTEIFDEVVSQFFKPVRYRLVTILAKQLGLPITDPKVGNHATRIIFLCIQSELLRPVIERFGSKVPSAEDDVRKYAQELYQFIIHGIGIP